MPFVPGQSGNPAGKPRGARSKKTIERETALKELVLRLHHDLAKRAATTTAHGVMVAIYQHPDTPPEMRMEAAKAAIRYEMPALMATQVSGTVEVNLTFAERLANARKRLEAYAGPTIDMPPASAREEILSCTETGSS